MSLPSICVRGHTVAFQEVNDTTESKKSTRFVGNEIYFLVLVQPGY